MVMVMVVVVECKGGEGEGEPRGEGGGDAGVCAVCAASLVWGSCSCSALIAACV